MSPALIAILSGTHLLTLIVGVVANRALAARAVQDGEAVITDIKALSIKGPADLLKLARNPAALTKFVADVTELVNVIRELFAKLTPAPASPARLEIAASEPTLRAPHAAAPPDPDFVAQVVGAIARDNHVVPRLKVTPETTAETKS